MTLETPARRYRMTFRTVRSLAYVSVIELGTVWERTLRRARIPVRYSQGFTPRPRMHFAAPLPVGCGTEADLLDVTLTEPMTPDALLAALEGAAPRDLYIVAATPVDEAEPALSEQLVAAEYDVWLREVDRDVVQSSAERVLAAETLDLPRRGKDGKTYDLRPLVLAMDPIPDLPAPWSGLRMLLQARTGATGRPDDVLTALGFDTAPRRCTRTRLILETGHSEEER
jgi:radical SAM-linked protein